MLAEPFPSPPGRPGRYVIYQTYLELDQVHIWAAKYAAKIWVLECLGDSGWVLDGYTMLRSERGVRMRCEYMSEIMEYELCKEELQWELPVPYNRMARAFRAEVERCTR